jgi:hypothetical protein
MRDPARIDRIMAKLVEAWKLSPDQRLAQLVMNAVMYACNKRVHDIFGVEDGEMERGLDRMLEDLKHPKPPTATSKAIDAFMSMSDPYRALFDSLNVSEEECP